MGPLKLGGRTLLLEVKGLLENQNDSAVALEVSVGFSLPGLISGKKLFSVLNHL